MRGTRLFFGVVLPGLVLVNLGLGLGQLVLTAPRGRLGWAALAGGAFTLVLAGWLAGAWWSRLYWRGVIARQVRTWHNVVDAVFAWIDELPLSSDALRGLKARVDRIAPERDPTTPGLTLRFPSRLGGAHQPGTPGVPQK